MRIIFSFVFCFVLFLNTAFAGAWPNAGTFIAAGKNGSLTTSGLIASMDESFGDGLVNILKLLYIVGEVIAVCIFIFMAVQVLIASPQQKAQLKASLYPYFIGLLLFIAGVPLAVLIINIIIQIF